MSEIGGGKKTSKIRPDFGQLFCRTDEDKGKTAFATTIFFTYERKR